MAAVINGVTGLDVHTIDLTTSSVRELNAELHAPTAQHYEVRNPRGAHAIAAALSHPISIDVRGHAGYYCAGMNALATVTVHGSVGTGVAENMMSGGVRVKGFAGGDVAMPDARGQLGCGHVAHVNLDGAGSAPTAR